MPEDPRELAELLATCLERVETEGPDALDAMCAEHPEHAGTLRRRVGALTGAGLLRGVPRFGRYRVERVLGRGGMGVVYLARDEELDRVVALKALPGDLGSNERVLARFRREIRAIARLRHPGIVPIYDVGDADGVPYFTMEYVEGRTLAEVLVTLRARGVPPERLDGRDLSDVRAGESWPRAVAALGAEVADALAHAHEHGVVHRDVKPSNVLVADDGRALLFDFGLARLGRDATLTMTGDFAGTLHYVAPEQIAGREVDGRTDVYALGLTLHELLTLQRAFAGETPEEVYRLVLTRDPPPPRSLNPSVPADLETVCLHAIEKRRRHRYPRAADLADDLRRVLAGHPVRARPVGRTGRLVRWAGRNRAAAAALALAAALAVGVPLGLWRANLAVSAEMERSAREARRLARVNDLLRDILASPDPDRVGKDASVLQLLDDAVERLPRDLADDPDTLETMHRTLGRTFFALGRYDRAEEQQRAALALLEAMPDGGPAVSVSDALSGLGAALAEQQRLDEALPLLARSVEASEPYAAERPELYATHLNRLAVALSRAGRNDEALALLEDARARLGDARTHAVGVLEQNLAHHHLVRGRTDEAEAAYRRAIPLLVGEDGESSASARARLALARFAMRRGEFAEAEEQVRLATGTLERMMEPGHPHLLDARVMLAEVLVQGEDRDAARAAADAAFAELDALDPSAANTRPPTVQRLSLVLLHLGDVAGALPLLEEALRWRLDEDGIADPGCAEAIINLGWALGELGRHDEAAAHFEEFAERYRVEYGEDHWLRKDLLGRLADARAAAGDG